MKIIRFIMEKMPLVTALMCNSFIIKEIHVFFILAFLFFKIRRNVTFVFETPKSCIIWLNVVCFILFFFQF